MIKRSEDNSIEVSVLRKANGRFTVSAKQLVAGNIQLHIDIIFCPGQNFTRLKYNTQDAPQMAKTLLERTLRMFKI